MAGTNGARCTIRFDRARTMSTPNGNSASVCWCSRLESIVRNTSQCAAARRRSSPFFTPDQPSACTVKTSCSVSSRARSNGTFSSSRTRTGEQSFLRDVQGGDRLLPVYGGELAEELVECFSALQVIEERPKRHTGADKDGRAAENLGVAVNNRPLCRHRLTSSPSINRSPRVE